MSLESRAYSMKSTWRLTLGLLAAWCSLATADQPWIPGEKNVALHEQPPVSITNIDDSLRLFDFGQVAFGNIELVVKAAGKFRVHFGEKQLDGRIDRQPPGSVRYYVVPVENAEGQPALVYPPPDARNTEQISDRHPPAVLTPPAWGTLVPFRWLEIETMDGSLLPEIEVIRRSAFSRSWDDEAARFQSSNPTLDAIWELCRYSIKATTFAGVYIDGDRERIPYEGDAYLNQLNHYATDHDIKMARDTFTWLLANGTWPSEWAPNMIFIAHADFLHTADIDWLREQYPKLHDKMLEIRVGASGLVESSDPRHRGKDLVDWPPGERDGFVFRPINTVVNAFHLASLDRMRQLADYLGETDDSLRFAQLYRERLAMFLELLYMRDRKLFRDGIGTDHSSQHANLFPLAFGLVPAEDRQELAAELASRGMRCSVYAAHYLLEALFVNQADAQAMELILADTDRSWKHMLESGTTITWEAWDQKYKPNQDWNHAWGAAPANLLPRFVLGVNPLQPGWMQCKISPYTAGLEFAEGTVPTPRGPIHVRWDNAENFRLHCQLPPGMTAVIELPMSNERQSVWHGDQQLSARHQGDRLLLVEAMSGTVDLEIRGD